MVRGYRGAEATLKPFCFNEACGRTDKEMNRRFTLAALVSVAALLLYASQAHAQFLGHNAPGDYGLQSGTQAPPGIYLVAPLYLRYDSDTVRNGLGNRSPLQADVGVNAYVFGVSWVSNVKVIGANYSFGVFPGFTDNKLEAPVIGVTQGVDTGFTDLYVQPINLGLGMWSFEVFGGTTVYFDEAKSWHVATTAYYETHTEKEGSDIKVGDILTFEGGLGKSFMQGALSVGPEVSIPIASKRKLYGFLNFRYLWETGVRNNLEGNLFVLTASFPIPSVSLQ